MTPKQKAIELVNKFIRNADNYKFEMIKNEDINQAKQYALIAVDEILNVCLNEISNCSDRTFFYWKQVKQEIEKL